MEANTSGIIKLTGNMVVFESAIFPSWQLSLSDIVCIGEYTNESGPYGDDYFLAFVTKECDAWYEASIFAEGYDIFLGKISVALSEEIKPSLANSTSFKSRILWPKHLLGQEMFEFRYKGFCGWLKLRSKQYFSESVLSLKE